MIFLFIVLIWDNYCKKKKTVMSFLLLLKFSFKFIPHSFPHTVYSLIFHWDFAGEIPRHIGDLIGLEMLSFISDGLKGRIPSFIGNLTLLSILDLSFNKFTGNNIFFLLKFISLATTLVRKSLLNNIYISIFFN